MKFVDGKQSDYNIKNAKLGRFVLKQSELFWIWVIWVN